MLPAVAGFELRYQLRNPLLWGTAAMLFLLAFAVIASPALRLGAPGNVQVNAPRAIAQTQLLFVILHMLAAVGFVAGAANRDAEAGFESVVHSSPVRARDYLLGRLFGALAASAVLFLAVPFGMYAGTFMPSVDPITLGPARLSSYLEAYASLTLPVLTSSAAILFAAASLARSMMAAYLALVALLSLHFAIASIGFDRPDLRPFLSTLDPFGLAAFRDAVRYWTALESDTAMPSLQGPLLWGRLLWLGLAGALVLGAIRMWRGTGNARAVRPTSAEPMPDTAPWVPPVTAAYREFGRRTRRAQFLARTSLEFKLVFESLAFLALLALGLANVAATLLFGGDQFGVPTLPTAREVIPVLTVSFWAVSALVATYYAGEVVWRERERKINEVIDSTPLPPWALLAPKMVAVALVLVASLVLSAAVAIAIQLADGQVAFEPAKYLLWYLLPAAVDAMLIAVLATFLQTLSPHKYVGWALMVLYLLVRSWSGSIGLDHSLFVFGVVPGVPLSDMNGAGSFWKGAWWFRLHWALWAAMFLLIAHLLWRRGAQSGLKARLSLARSRVRGRAALIAAGLLAALVGTGGWIVYSTTILNDHRSGDESERFAAEYERRFLPFEQLPQPTITATKLDVALYPQERRAEVTGRYQLSNLTSSAVRDVHVRIDRELTVHRLELEGAQLVSRDDGFGYFIFRLSTPMSPGETRALAFTTRRWPRGFRDGGEDLDLVENGTFLSNLQLAPLIGMDRGGLLQEPAVRRRHGLQPELRPPRLEDDAAAQRPLFGGGWTSADITITTSADQVPIGPGERIEDLVEAGRRRSRFVAQRMLGAYSIHSARYAERHRIRRGVDLAVYHEPKHGWNVELMLDTLEAGLDYYERSFGPLLLRQVRIVEFPAYAGFARALPATIAMSELIPFVADPRERRGRDYVAFVTAHELAHQWWVHQLIGANVQGATMLVETLAEYSALMVMRRMAGEQGVRRFLRRELDEYLSSRGFDPGEELPLVRVENQPYIHYHKGGMAMYLLQHRLGEAAVNRALLRLLQRYRFRGPPYPRSSELVALLRMEADEPHEQTLITDLFERITLYDLRVAAANASRRPDGRWDVTVIVDAAKRHLDGGVERESPLAEPIEIGLFGADPADPDLNGDAIEHLAPETIRSGRNRFQFVTSRRPAYVGIDPFSFHIDRNPEDNVRTVD
jgi:ABC-type transport system involved in multi-copper enzyme maturation permease subunit